MLPRLVIVAALMASSGLQARPLRQDQPLATQAGTNPVAVAVPAPAPRASGHAPGDPFEKLNRSLFSRQQKFDRGFFRPLARAYATIIPKFIRTGLRHLLSHIREPIVFANDILQLKPKRAAQTFARFFINTTAGIGGLFDVAKTAELPHRNNGLGNTLARYGVGPGPYLFIPFVGPTQLRDLFGTAADGFVYPVAIGSPFNRTDFQVSTGVIEGLDKRAEADAGFKALLDGAADPYATLRSVYQQDRAAEIAEIKGMAASPGGLDDPLLDPEADPTAPVDSTGETPPEATDPLAPSDAPAPAPAPAAVPEPAPTAPAPPLRAAIDAGSVVSFF